MADGPKPSKPKQGSPPNQSGADPGHGRGYGQRGTAGGARRSGPGNPAGAGGQTGHGGRGPTGHGAGGQTGHGGRGPTGHGGRGPSKGRPGSKASRANTRAEHRDTDARSDAATRPDTTPGAAYGPGGDLGNLTILGGAVTQPSRRLETFPNKHRGRRYVVTLVCPEFTCLCPATGQPDFATITVRYVPDGRIVESKSLKLYLWSFRQEGHFHEHVTNIILDDLVRALDPVSCEVTGAFSTRGGIHITVESRHNR